MKLDEAKKHIYDYIEKTYPKIEQEKYKIRRERRQDKITYIVDLPLPMEYITINFEVSE